MSGAPPTVVNTYRRAIFAARYLKPPSQYKRQLMREKPRSHTAPFENPVRRYVRLKEKERLFSLIPQKRMIPVPKKYKPKMLNSIEGVPEIAPAALVMRLQHLLGDSAIHQQIAEPIFPFEGTGNPEFRMWKRQLREIRKIYRAQYLQKLAEVTEDERLKQFEMMEQENKVKTERKLTHRANYVADMKRRAVLKDRQRLDEQLELSAKLQKASNRKARLVFFKSQLEAKASILGPEGLNETLGEGSVAREQAGLQARVFDRNVSVPHMMERLGKGEYLERSVKKRLAPHFDVFRKVADESFKLLPEDQEPLFDEQAARSAKVGLSARERAQARYASFSEEDKLRLLDEKINMIRSKLDKESALLGGAQDGGHWTLLLEQLEGAKMAYLEKRAMQEGKERVTAANN